MAEVTNTKDPAKPKPTDGVTLTIDGREVVVPKGSMVLDAARQLGIHIPTFCWHPKLKSVGACRMCYVEIEKFRTLAVACATPVMEGMVVRTDTEKVKSGRRAVLEFILANHPLDCPTCDQGGECELQDITFAHGSDQSRFDFQKNRFTKGAEASVFNDLNIGPALIHNRNRCILCYRCVRANKEAFGEFDLGVFERGNITEIGAAPGQQVDNPFSGNLAENCPVGALTNSDFRYKIRNWLTTTVDSICNMSSSGANIRFSKEDHKNHIYRTKSRCNDSIDDGWLTDITRYSYQIVNSPDRLKTPLIKKEGRQVEATWDEAIKLVHERFSDIKSKKGSVCVGGLASPSLDNTSLYSFSKFFRTVLKSNNVDYRCDYRYLPQDTENVFSSLCSRPFKIADIDDSDVIVMFGTDMIREHHNEYLRIRKARNFGSARIFSLNPYAVKSADVADLEVVYNIGCDEIVMNALCLAAAEEGLADSFLVGVLKEKIAPSSLSEAAKLAGVDENDLKMIVRALAEGKKITFLMGEIITRSKARDSIASAVSNLNLLLGIEGKGQISVLARYANSQGAEMLGLSPGPSTATKDKLASMWGQFPDSEEHTTDAMFAQMRKEEIAGMLVLGANPMQLYPDREFARECLERVEFLVACDLFETETTALADVVLPLSSWAEYSGEYVNLEGVVQRANGAIRRIGQSRPGHEIMAAVADGFDCKLFESSESADREIAELLSVGQSTALPTEIFEVRPEALETSEDYPVPLIVGDDSHHSGHLTEKAPLLMDFASETYVELSADLAARYDIKEGDSVRIESEAGKIIVPAVISEHIDNNVIFIPRNFSATPVTTLLMRKRRVDWVKLSKVDE